MYSQLSGYVWIDTNNDGIREPGEPTPSNISVLLFQTNLIANTTTDSNGYYSFNYVIPGISFYLF